MTLYVYRHLDEDPACQKAPTFRWEQPPYDWPLTKCPWCQGPVERQLEPAMLKVKKFDCELRDQGFTKLVRVDEGVFENRTRRLGEEKYVDRHRPETFPHLEKTIED
ncbi:MAG: zinc ribbon domain-containing protein [Deltaproteobacteria bacterium]|jgi:rubredoxin|nr:zinc ribbon domain-containing protein [Deltaproteobacteria bacterium]